MPNHHELANFIWQIADLLRGPYRPPQYERVMLPMTVLRRFDCVLGPTKEMVLAEYKKRKGGKLNDEALEKFLNKAAGQRFHNHSSLTFEKLKGDPDNINHNLVSYIKGFSRNVRDIFDYFEFENEILKMSEADILFKAVSKFCDMDLHPDRVDNLQMGLVFEDLIRRFNEAANETAGDHFTPREVIRLMVNVLFINDDDLLSKAGTVRTLLDPACGTGGMLAEAQNYMREHHRDAKLFVYGQDYNKRAFATAASDMLIKQVDHNGAGDNIKYGDSFTDDQFEEKKFDYLLTNPPFGVDWKKQQNEIVRQHEKQGFAGRFGAGLPRVNDGSLLFLQHMISKFEPVRPKEHKHGSRLAIVFNGSPLFTGSAGSGESNIRKWIIENDWLEAIIALPEQMFYNTGIGTYVWIVTNRKERHRKGKIQLIDAREQWKPMRRSLGNKRRELGEDDIATIVREYGSFKESETSKIFDNSDFGYTRVTVERPLRLSLVLTEQSISTIVGSIFVATKTAPVKALMLSFGDDLSGKTTLRILMRLTGKEFLSAGSFIAAFKEAAKEDRPSVAAKKDWDKGIDAVCGKIFESFGERNPKADVVLDKDGKPKPDSNLRDFENIPLKEDIDEYFRREVLPHVADAWMDRSKDKVGYEINFNRYFYKYVPPRPLEEIDADLKKAEEEIMRLLKEVTM